MSRTALKTSTWVLSLALALALSGCSVLPVAMPFMSVLVSGAGGGVAYTMTNVAYKTFSHSLDDVEEAAHIAIKRMEIEEVSTEKVEDGKTITAFTKKLDILINLEEITPSTTKVKVNAKRGPVLKDKSTATEIIRQMEVVLEGPVIPAVASPKWARAYGGAAESPRPGR